MILPQPILQPVPNSGEQMILAVEFRTVLPISGRTLVMREGFPTDGTSIPPMFWSMTGVAPFDPDFLAGSVPHDGLYGAELLSRQECDDEFEALLKLNSPRSQAHAIVFFDAVRLGGIFVWDKHTPETISAAKQYCSLL